MGILIFKRGNNTRSSRLYMNDDKTFTYESEAEGWAIGRSEDTEETISADVAKERWPQYADKIDEALSRD